MRLEVGCVDHDPVRLAAAACQSLEDAVEHAQPAPSNEPVVQRLVRPVRRRRIAPAQAVADDEDDAAQHTTVVHAGHAVRQRTIRLEPTKLLLGQQEQLIHAEHLRTLKITRHRVEARTLTGPEPTYKEGEDLPL